MDPRSLCFNLQTRNSNFYRAVWLKTQLAAGNGLTKGERDMAQRAISRAKTFSELRKIGDFEFDFDVLDRSRAFGEIRTLVESAGLKMKFASQQIWHIVLPNKTVKVTISELQQLYEGHWGINEGEWTDDHYKLSQRNFREFGSKISNMHWTKFLKSLPTRQAAWHIRQ